MFLAINPTVRSAAHGRPGAPKGLQAIGHYTQMVWWSTEAVGAAMAVGPRGTYAHGRGWVVD